MPTPELLTPPEPSRDNVSKDIAFLNKQSVSFSGRSENVFENRFDTHMLGNRKSAYDEDEKVFETKNTLLENIKSESNYAADLFDADNDEKGVDLNEDEDLFHDNSASADSSQNKIENNRFDRENILELSLIHI